MREPSSVPLLVPFSAVVPRLSSVLRIRRCFVLNSVDIFHRHLGTSMMFSESDLGGPNV